MTGRPPARAKASTQPRADWEAAGQLRLQLVRELVRLGIPPDAAHSSVDSWLLIGLAAEELDISGAGGAFQSARARDVGPVEFLARRVELATGLTFTFDPQIVEKLRKGLQVPLPFRVFSQLRGYPDPFGTLGQWLRGQRVVERDGAWSVEETERRRDTGGYYTPYKLAKSIAERTLQSCEEIPSIIDPACGAGTFLAAAFDVLREKLEQKRRTNPLLSVEPIRWPIAALHGVELDPAALLAARLSLAVRAVKAQRAEGRAGQLGLFGQSTSLGPLIMDRLRLGDSLGNAPRPTLAGTERLRLRLLARDVPGRLPQTTVAASIEWDATFPQRFSDPEGAFKPGGFGVVLTNPPFVPVDRIPEGQRQALMASLSTAQRRFDLFIGFVERALTLLEQNGRATLLIPRTFLTEANAEKCRRLILEKASIERIEELGMVVFDEARVPCVAITFVAHKPTDATLVAVVRAGALVPAMVPQHAFELTPKAMWRVELAEPAAAECLRLAELGVPLGKYFCASWGARGTPVSEFHLDAPSHPSAKPMLKADDVQPLRVEKSTRWLVYDRNLLYRPSRKEFFESEKILIRKVTGSKGLVAAVDTGRHYTDDSLACVVRKADLASIPRDERLRHKLEIAPSEIEPSRAYDLHLVAALVQTTLIQTYYRVLLGGGLNVFPELIESLPLPRPDALRLPEADLLATAARAAAAGEPYDQVQADRWARILYGLDVSAN